MQAIEDLGDLVKAIGGYKSLDELVVFTHGFMGGITLGGEGYSLSDAKITKAFSSKKTQIDHVRFEGCWVGEGPVDMVVFGQLFDAIDVSGFKWAHWSVDNSTFTLPRARQSRASSASKGRVRLLQ